SAEGYPRLSPHRGIDFSGKTGADVLAAADGHVTVAEDSRDLCGLKVVIVHEPYGYLTIYCHFSAIAVQPGEMVKRGQRIGALGTTGQRAWPGYERSEERRVGKEWRARGAREPDRHKYSIDGGIRRVGQRRGVTNDDT